MSRKFILSASMLPLLLLPLTACQQAGQGMEATGNPVPMVSGTQDELIQNLQSRVGTLESQMKSAQPTLKKVEAIEGHFRSLSLELDRIEQTYKDEEKSTPPVTVPAAAAPVPVVVPVTEPVVEKKAAEVATPKISKSSAASAKPVVAAGGLAVTSVRVGEQPKNITRIVLDTNKLAEIHYDLDNTEKLLVIDVPKAKWMTKDSQTFPKSPLVKSFHAVQDENGSAHLVLELKQDAKVVATARLAPSGNSGNRVYVDIVPLK